MLSTEEITIAKNTFRTAQYLTSALYIQSKMFGFQEAAAVHRKRLMKYRNYAFILEYYTEDCIDCVNLDDIVCEVENIPIKYLVNCNGELS